MDAAGQPPGEWMGAHSSLSGSSLVGLHHADLCPSRIISLSTLTRASGRSRPRARKAMSGTASRGSSGDGGEAGRPIEPRLLPLPGGHTTAAPATLERYTTLVMAKAHKVRAITIIHTRGNGVAQRTLKD
eukprot:scaffold2495_cov101-Isochrysis_galbana.AAC.16